jgi:peptidoglycan hydrolase-like protein with peptidoglycan-binding domain
MKYRFAVTSLMLVAPSLIFAVGTSFPRTLQIGMAGDDVRALQVVLNSDASTRIADSGPGSRGYETNYFGPATKRAVVKFQEKYKEEVLLPVGLSQGTGFFGEKTRAKANALSFGATIPKENPIFPISTTTQNPVGIPVVVDELKGVVIKTPSQYFGKPGTSITISGWGFTAGNNTVIFGDIYKVDGLASTDGYSITLSVPSIPKGVYIVSVKNSIGDSQTKTFFAVTDGTTALPKIESITPEHATRGSIVTIKGSGFSKTGNMLRTTLGVFENLSSSDGTAILLTIPSDIYQVPPAGFNIPEPSTTVSRAALSLPVIVYVVNENGLSNSKSFTGDL